jgi:hypothetical protein
MPVSWSHPSLTFGSHAPGLWPLESNDTRFKPIEDAELLWALPFMGLRV